MKTRIVSVRVSDLARAWVGWGTLEQKPYVPRNGPAEVIHESRKYQIASTPQSVLLLQQLDRFFSRCTSNMLIKGVFDGLRVIRDTRISKDVVSLVEFKTVVESASEAVKDMAAFQLQLYIWLLKPLIERKGYALHRRSYVEIIRRTDGKLIERFPVAEDPDIVEKVWLLFAEYDGILVTNQEVGT